MAAVPVIHRREHGIVLVENEVGTDRDLDEISVRIVAISMIRSLAGSSPVISMSSQTRTSLPGMRRTVW
jgi:hypothetical protein